ncbi:serine hydrolase domain-containing protein [Salinactinospora qingdaonensis]|uniref:Beta-lactamase-related domain-containing protein n=1 Tax=Salinactinospora qingdaonensis TaxID=702744 RepID=A0ABP7F1S1_9ACTN
MSESPLLVRPPGTVWIAAGAAALAATVVALLLLPTTEPAAEHTAGDEELAAQVSELLPDDTAVGVSVAVIEGETTRQAALGTTDGSTPVEVATPFETGSIMKTVTATLLAEMVESGEVELETTLGEIWPETEFSDERAADITLEQIATHHSGIPRLAFADPYVLAQTATNEVLGGQAYAAFDSPIEDMAAMPLLDAPGASYAYSNLGYAVLGQSLEQVLGTDYATAVRQRVLEPVGMEHTTLRATDEAGLPPGAALPHAEPNVPTAAWRAPDYLPVGAGSWSTAGDLAAFLRASTEEDSPIAAAAALAREPREPAGESTETGLGWAASTTAEGNTMTWHNGASSGTRTFFGRSGDRGVVVMANSAAVPVEALGTRLIETEVEIFPELSSGSPISAALGTAGGALLFPLLSIAFALRGRARLSVLATDRLGLLGYLLASTTLWLIVLRIGNWGSTPLVIGALGAGLLAAAVVLSGWRWPSVPLTRGTRPWLRWITFLIPAALFALLLYTVIAVFTQLP